MRVQEPQMACLKGQVMLSSHLATDTLVTSNAVRCTGMVNMCGLMGWCTQEVLSITDLQAPGYATECSFCDDYMPPL